MHTYILGFKTDLQFRLNEKYQSRWARVSLENLALVGWLRWCATAKMGLVMLVMSATVLAADINVYVSPAGNDQWSGNIPDANSSKTEGPVVSLARARNRVRELKKLGAGPKATIFMRNGYYEMAEPLVLGAEDSGASGLPLLITRYKNEHVIISGAVTVPKFSPYKGEILYADLDPAKFKGNRISQVLFDGQEQTLARYPNADPAHPITGGWAYVDGAPVTSQVNRDTDSKRQFNMKATDIRKWPTVEGGEIFIFPRYNWNNDIAPIARYDGISGLLILGSDITYDIRPGDRYFVQNLLSELDAPGEWYFDNKASRLYFWPPQKIAASSTVMVSHLDTLFEVSNAQNIQIRGLDMQVSEGATINLMNSSHCLVAANMIRNTGLRGRGTYAVNVAGGNDNQIIGNDISNVGGSGIMLSGGDVKTLTASKHLADNNVIHHAGQKYKQGVGVQLAGVGSVVRNNLIYDLPRMGILAVGNDHLIELNKIHYVNLETADSGAIYTSGRDWLNSRGIVIKNNEILDSKGFGYDLQQHKWRTNYFSFGIYLDDDSSGVDVVGNIIGRTSWSGVIVHGGTYNNISNNIIFDAGSDQVYFLGFGDNDPFRILARKNQAEYSQYVPWQKYRGFACCNPDTVKSLSNNVFEKNIVVYSGNKNVYLAERWLPSEGNKISNNVIYNRNGNVMIDNAGEQNLQSWTNWQKRGFDTNSILADPGLSVGNNGSVVLSKSSVALSKGFSLIPIDKIGPYKSEYRATWPIQEIISNQENLQ